MTLTFVSHFIVVLTFSSDNQRKKKKRQNDLDIYTSATDAARSDAKRNIFSDKLFVMLRKPASWPFTQDAPVLVFNRCELN